MAISETNLYGVKCLGIKVTRGQDDCRMFIDFPLQKEKFQISE